MNDTVSSSNGSVTPNRSVARAITMLRVLAGRSSPATVSEVARKAGLARPTAFRILQTLEEEGFVDRSDNLYSVGWDLARIGRLVDPAAGLVARVHSTVQGLAEDLEETVTLSIRHGLYDLDVVLQESARSLAVTVSDMRGKKWPLHASATGKVLLAELEPDQIDAAVEGQLTRFASKTITTREALDKELQSIRELGWAQIDDELEDGIFSLAVPLRDSVGWLVAILAVLVPKHRAEAEDSKEKYLEILLRGAERLRSQLSSETGPHLPAG